MYLTQQQIDTFCQVFNLDKSVLTERTFSVDTSEACTLDEFLQINFSVMSDCIKDYTFENYLSDEQIQMIMKLNVNEETEADMQYASVTRLS